MSSVQGTDVMIWFLYDIYMKPYDMKINIYKIKLNQVKSN